jgi:hypothetical protein
MGVYAGRGRAFQSQEDRTNGVRIYPELLGNRRCLPRTVVVVVEEQHDPLGVIPFLEFVGVGVFELVDIDGAARHRLVLGLLENSCLVCCYRG